MQSDRQRWNEKYRRKDHESGSSDLIARFADRAPTGYALDLATGTGANALALARRGFVVDAVDIADRALRALAGKHPRVRPICADLDRMDIAPGRYSLIANLRYLNRRLFPYILEGLVAGGLLIFETYLEDPSVEGFQPSTRDYLLRPNELLRAFLPLRIIFYQERSQGRDNEPGPLATLVAHRHSACKTNRDEPA